MSNTEGVPTEPAKPVSSDDVKFPPFPEPTDDDFDEDISEEERNYYKELFSDLNTIKTSRLHCSACDRHLGSSIRNEGRMRAHPLLRTLVCHTCHTFYNSGEFEKGDDGSELYCRWCGQGGQVYCCSDCPHVFCAKCIKRNLGVAKIKEIENTDDWKCFKCNPKCLWDLRALCWALLRYCDLKNKMLYQTQDSVLREQYIKDSGVDHTECCRNKQKRKEKKKDNENVIVKSIPLQLKPTSTIQVKKFASINNTEEVKKERKPPKRSVSPIYKQIIIKNPISLANSPGNTQPMVKRIRGPNTTVINPVRISNDKKQKTYHRIKPKPMMPLGMVNNFNGFNNVGNFSNMSSNMVVNFNDTLNLSLDSLTQGLDMSAVAHLSSTEKNDDVVCTPDLPLEALCEVTEDNDDDVQCITPGPSTILRPTIKNPPPLVPRMSTPADLSFENIIQMTENDVTINEATGGLKFRVDPQTLSSNKMYRLPDGRIFAINVNPNMPGGYSATIVAVSDKSNKLPPKGATYAAKLSAVSQTISPIQTKRRQNQTQSSQTNSKQHSNKPKSTMSQNVRECDLNVPVEWFRYNLLDAIDCLEYSLIRLNKLKRDATTMHLRTRTVDEMRGLHRNLERLLNTSSNRFVEIRQNINKELKQYLNKKKCEENSQPSEEDDDDDDVEILPNENNEGPIFIDENSIDSQPENQEVDLTGAGSSEHNDSVGNKIGFDPNDSNVLDTFYQNNEASMTSGDFQVRSLNCSERFLTFRDDVDNDTFSEKEINDKEKKDNGYGKLNKEKTDTAIEKPLTESNRKHSLETNGSLKNVSEEQELEFAEDMPNLPKNSVNNKVDDFTDAVMAKDPDESKDVDEVDTKTSLPCTPEKEVDKENNQESEISDEMIETLLKDDSMGDNLEASNASVSNPMDISEN